MYPIHFDVFFIFFQLKTFNFFPVCFHFDLRFFRSVLLHVQVVPTFIPLLVHLFCCGQKTLYNFNVFKFVKTCFVAQCKSLKNVPSVLDEVCDLIIAGYSDPGLFCLIALSSVISLLICFCCCCCPVGLSATEPGVLKSLAITVMSVYASCILEIYYHEHKHK